MRAAILNIEVTSRNRRSREGGRGIPSINYELEKVVQTDLFYFILFYCTLLYFTLLKSETSNFLRDHGFSIRRFYGNGTAVLIGWFALSNMADASTYCSS